MEVEIVHLGKNNINDSERINVNIYLFKDHKLARLLKYICTSSRAS